MSKKQTKRKAFNFLRSYYDVLNELEKDKDKLDFLESILDKQFLNKDPEDLSFIPNLCYESQRHAIEKSVKGWLRVNNGDPMSEGGSEGGSDPMSEGGSDPKEEEEEEEEKEEEEEEKEIYSFGDFWSVYDKKVDVKKCKYRYSKVSPADQQKIKDTISDYVTANAEKQFRKNPLTYLNGECWKDEIEMQPQPKRYNPLDTIL